MTSYSTIIEYNVGQTSGVPAPTGYNYNFPLIVSITAE